MRIGVVSWFNPSVISDLIIGSQNVPDINRNATSVNTIVREMIEQGHSVVVFTHGPIRAKFVTLCGNNVTIYILNSDFGIRGLANLDRIYMVSKLRRLIASHIEEVDLLHAHWTYEFALAAKSFANRVPVFCSVRDWCPYIMSMQTTLKDKIRWNLYYFIFKNVMRGNSIHFIANSDYTYQQIMKTYPEKIVHIIPNPILKDYILKEKKNKNNSPSFISICQGIGDKRKNIDSLLIAFSLYRKKHQNAILKLVGGGFERGNSIVENWQRKGLLDGVELCGYVPHKELMRFLDRSNVLIHPSLEETFGNILLEGMARCLVVIGGVNSGAVPQVLGGGEYGLLCDVLNIDSIVNAMNLTDNQSLCNNYIKKGTQCLLNNYASDAVVNKHIEIYSNYLNA